MLEQTVAGCCISFSEVLFSKAMQFAKSIAIDGIVQPDN